MLRAIVLKILAWLEQSLDPDLQERLKAYHLKVEAAEAEEKRLLAEIEASKTKLEDLSREFTDNQRRRLELENAILGAKAEAEKKKAELDALSDRDLLRRGL